jgi:multisubunit Na+/H+ antiporter MnhC subunit
MSSELSSLLRIFIIAIPLLFIVGFYCIIVTRNLVRVLIGMELLTKAVTLLIIVVGYATNHVAMAQALVITLIVVEVVVIAVEAGIVLNVFNHNDSLDVRNLRSMKG